MSKEWHFWRVSEKWRAFPKYTHTHKNSSAFMKFATRRTMHAVRMWTKWHTTVTLSFCVTESVGYAWNYTVSPNYLTQFKVNFDFLFILTKRFLVWERNFIIVLDVDFSSSSVSSWSVAENLTRVTWVQSNKECWRKKEELKSSRMASMTRRKISKWRRFGARTYWHVVIFIFPSSCCFKFFFLPSSCSLHEMEF